MTKKIGILLSAVLTLASVANAAAPRNTLATKPAPHSSASITTLKRAPHTPQERYLMPALQKRLAERAVKQDAISGIHAEALGTSAVTSNWGGFLSPTYSPTRLNSTCIVDPGNCGVAAALAADVTKSGTQDLIIIQYDGTLNVLTNNGSGSFAAPVEYANPNYSSTEILAAYVADVNNDGYPDVVALDQFNNALLVYLNLKNGTYGSPTAIDLTYNNGSVNAFAIGDVNGDGNLDVVKIGRAHV